MLTTKQRAEKIRLLCLDVDGTLTDGRLYPRDGGGYGRVFHVLDGHGIKRLREVGITVAFITMANIGEELNKRAAHIGVLHVYQQVSDKLSVVQNLLRAEELAAEQAAFVGDDIQDLLAMQAVGFVCAPPTAVAPVLAAAHYISHRSAGCGAVREICDLILCAQNTP